MTTSTVFQCAFLTIVTFSVSRGETLRVGPAVAISFDVLHADMTVWSYGNLLSVTGNPAGKPIIHALDRSGHATSAFVPQIPGADRIALCAIGRQPSGGVVASGFSWTPDGREATFIAILSADGKNQQTIRTNPYTTYGLAVAPDGTIWAAGLEMINRSENNPQIDPNYLMVRHFDATGRPLGGSVPRSSLPKHPLGVSESVLVANRDSVGWLWGNNYFAISTSGDTRRFVAPTTADDFITVGLTDSGSTLLTTQDGSCRSLCALRNNDWVPVTLPESFANKKGLVIYGTDGDDLVVRERAGSSDTFYAHFLPVRP